LEEIGIPELTSDQRKELCEIAEKSARKYILSKVSSSKISALNITIDAQGTKPLNVDVDIEITLAPPMKDYDVKKLTHEAREKAFASIETCLRELKCQQAK
jgi:hypothetical protein